MKVVARFVELWERRALVASRRDPALVADAPRVEGFGDPAAGVARLRERLPA